MSEVRSFRKVWAERDEMGKRARREGKPARSGGDDVDDGRIIHSAAQKKGEERVCCVCVCARAREEEVGSEIS